jgi:transposase
MDTIYRRVAGLDVHKDSVQACVRIMDESGKVAGEVRSFSTMTDGIRELGAWLKAQAVTHVAMESTGVYWKPIWNLLEGTFQLLLVNARHVKNVPGRKTDVSDCQWLAQLLQCGLLRGSFVPDEAQRQARDLTRHRTQLVGERSRLANRIQKVLEDANIKLGSVASDVLGVSGRDMLSAMANGQNDPGTLADLALGRLKSKIPDLRRAFDGKVTDHHRFMLKLLLDQLEYLEDLIGQLEQRIEQVLAPFAAEQELLDGIPGVDKHVARVILAEVGADMSRFPTADHLAAWAGMSPGNDESAGKRRSGRTCSASRWIRAALVQAAWAASHTKNSYLAAQYKRLAKRRGRKRALVAVGHTILIITWHVLDGHTEYHELGGDYFDKLQPERLKRHLLNRLESLGYQVTLTPRPKVA